MKRCQKNKIESTKQRNGCLSQIGTTFQITKNLISAVSVHRGNGSRSVTHLPLYHENIVKLKIVKAGNRDEKR